MTQLQTAEDILAYFAQRELDTALDDESKAFLCYHCRRYEFLLRQIDQIIAETHLHARLHSQSLAILDVGPGFQTELLRCALPRAVINTLGFKDTRFEPRSQDLHFEFDLNEAQHPARWPALTTHQLILMAEVIEHLYTSPVLVLRCLSSWLEDGGYMLIQTPNACALHKRIRMLMGRNPYDMIRENRDNPGHFREYTLAELKAIATQAGFKLVRTATCNYFDNGTSLQALYNALSGGLPASLRQGITLILEKA